MNNISISIPRMTAERLKSIAQIHALALPKPNYHRQEPYLTDEQFQEIISILQPLAEQVEEVASLIRELDYYRQYGDEV